jgi:hypothetical protein
MTRYLVVARTDYAEPLSSQGMLDVPPGTDAAQLVLAAFGDQWVELALIPEHEMVWAQPDTTTAAPKEASL